MSSGDDNEMPEVDGDPVDVEPVDGGESSEGSGDDRAGGGPDIVSTPDSSRPILEEPDTDSGRVDQERSTRRFRTRWTDGSPSN
ncbi:MAG: hypothetical protein ABEL76_05775 [Bradymonadaceae bacterium]